MKGHFRGEFSAQRARDGQKPPTRETAAIKRLRSGSPCPPSPGLSSRPNPLEPDLMPTRGRLHVVVTEERVSAADMETAGRLFARWVARGFARNSDEGGRPAGESPPPPPAPGARPPEEKT